MDQEQFGKIINQLADIAKRRGATFFIDDVQTMGFMQEICEDVVIYDFFSIEAIYGMIEE